jgi:DNA-binding transcriptional regulator YhcF (GntR family)
LIAMQKPSSRGVSAGGKTELPKHRALLDFVQVDRVNDIPLHSQISRQIGSAIRDGQLPPGTALPSSRALAAELAVARGTVAIAYDQLLGENLLEVRNRSLTFVANALPERVASPPAAGEDSDAETAEAWLVADAENPSPYTAFLPGIPAFRARTPLKDRAGNLMRCRANRRDHLRARRVGDNM